MDSGLGFQFFLSHRNTAWMDWLWKGLHFFDTILLYRVLLSCIDRRMQLVQCALCTVCSPPGCHQQLGCNMTNLEIFMQGPTDRDTQKVNKSVYNKGWLKLGNFFFRKQGMQHLTLCQAILELHFCIIYNESHHRVGWSDIALFCDFRKRAQCCQSFQKYPPILFKPARRMRGKVFIFKKSLWP